MSAIIVDRRETPRGKSGPNRQRLLQRERSAVKEAIEKSLRDNGIKDVTSSASKKIKIRSGSGTKEPVFRHGSGGINERVYPGNKEFRKGDKIPRPQSSDGGGKKGSPDGEGEDDFIFEMSQQEYLNYVFEGLELPDLVKKALSGSDTFVLRRAGFSQDGPPSQLDVLRSMQQSHGRRISLRSSLLKKEKQLLKEKKEIEEKMQAGSASAVDQARLVEIDKELVGIARKKAAVPLFDDMDLRFRRKEKEPVPITKAVMFCLMDVSGSMGDREKDLAKRFFILLGLFLERCYERTEIVFIRHTHEAQEVDEDTFFFSRETGGTVVSTALEKMLEIIKERYAPEEWNIYGCQASDGENYDADSIKCTALLRESLLPITQYFAYIEILEEREMEVIQHDHGGELWTEYLDIVSGHKNFAMRRVAEISHIYPVFRSLFESTGKK